MAKIRFSGSLRAAGCGIALALVAAAPAAHAATTSPICPSGYHYNRPARSCAMTQAPTCGSRYAWNASRKLCVSTQIVRPSCPGGYHLLPQGCVSGPSGHPGAPTVQGQTSSTIPPTCPAGFTLASGNRCVSTATASPQCGGGYGYNASLGLCMKTEPASCPAGYRLDTIHGICSTGPVAQ